MCVLLMPFLRWLHVFRGELIRPAQIPYRYRLVPLSVRAATNGSV